MCVLESHQRDERKQLMIEHLVAAAVSGRFNVIHFHIQNQPIANKCTSTLVIQRNGETEKSIHTFQSSSCVFDNSGAKYTPLPRNKVD